jgi:hypothetical protein
VDALGILNICIGKYFFCNRTVLNEHFTLPGKFHFTGLVRWVCFYRTSPVEQEIELGDLFMIYIYRVIH